MTSKNHEIDYFFPFHEKLVVKTMKEVFRNEKWVGSFIKNDHHGFEHGNQTRLGSLKLIKKLNAQEKKKFLEEGNDIDKNNPYKSAVVAVEFASLFHDCGRFNDNGEFRRLEQIEHHIVGAKRARHFCETVGLHNLAGYVEKAVVTHDFQSKTLTEYMEPPKTMIGKIVQSSDQLGWFHPNVVFRTARVSQDIGRTFFRPEITTEFRLKCVKDISLWNYSPEVDTLTILLVQRFGYIGNDRFGIESARDKIATYKPRLERNIIKIAEQHGVRKEIENLVDIFKKHYENK